VGAELGIEPCAGTAAEEAAALVAMGRKVIQAPFSTIYIDHHE
jgi:hypothetical protein